MSTLSEEIRKEDAEKVENIDYKMVTFSLAGKDYGIDIMKVKEISKANRFTHVPNAAPYVRGVYNLRGDIISIIDLRIMFNIPAPKQEDQSLENMIILRLDDYHIGVIVDSIDKVVGIHSEEIQPPHPIFGDINIKFIKGVVENENRLYLILDVERIFGDHEEEEEKAQSQPALVREPELEQEEKEAAAEASDTTYSFVVEELLALEGFGVSPYNKDWTEARYLEWKRQRSEEGREVQLQTEEDAAAFLEPFYSPYTGSLWGDEYRGKISQLFTQHVSQTGSLLAWNPGCANGYETYSLAIVLRELFPDSSIKIWAHESDLMAISTAPNLTFKPEEVPQGLVSYTAESKNGLIFTKEIRDLILFEYHNVFHENPFPEVDLIVARDVLSFQKPKEQELFLQECAEKLKPGGLLLPGENERALTEDFEELAVGSIRAYRKIQR